MQTISTTTKRLVYVGLWLGFLAIVGSIGIIVISLLSLIYFLGVVHFPLAVRIYPSDLISVAPIFLFYGLILGLVSRLISDLALSRIRKEGGSDSTLTKIAKRGKLVGTLAMVVSMPLYCSVIMIFGSH